MGWAHGSAFQKHHVRQDIRTFRPRTADLSIGSDRPKERWA